jgi:MFS family permease
LDSFAVSRTATNEHFPEISTSDLFAITDVFLFGFIVPILPYMLEVRLGVDPANVQALTSGLLAVHAAASFISSPIIGIFADRIPARKGPLMIGLCGELVSTLIVAIAPNRECSQSRSPFANIPLTLLRSLVL